MCGEEVLSGSLRPYRDRILARQARYGQKVFMYGSPNNIGSESAVLRVVPGRVVPAGRLLPWNTIGTAKAWAEPEQTCLFYPTEKVRCPACG